MVVRSPLQGSALLDDVMRHVVGDVTAIGTPRRSLTDSVDLEMKISEMQAARGCVVAVGIPARDRCRACGGTGGDWYFACTPCRGRGSVSTERILRLRLPPGLSSGTIIELMLEGEGGIDLVARLRVLVDRRMRAPPAR
jgi:DnaJ-class molecular chaperone